MQLHIPPTKCQNKAANHIPTTTPKDQRRQPQGCGSTALLSGRLSREQCTQVQYQATRAVQMSEPMTFKNSVAAFLEKGWERGRKAQHSHSNRSSACHGSLGGRVMRCMCFLGFQSICHVIKSLAWELIRVLFSFSAACCSEAHADPCVKVHAAYTLVSPITRLSQTNLTFFHRLVGKMRYMERWGKQPGVSSKTAVCLLQLCSVIGKIEHAAFFKQPNHIYYYIRLTHHKLFSCNGRIFNLISWTRIISQLQSCNNFLSSHF